MGATMAKCPAFAKTASGTCSLAPYENTMLNRIRTFNEIALP